MLPLLFKKVLHTLWTYIILGNSRSQNILAIIIYSVLTSVLFQTVQEGIPMMENGIN